MKPISEMTLAEIAEYMDDMGIDFERWDRPDPISDICNRLRTIHDLTRWTDADVDSAYIMGCINAHSVKVTESAVFPTLIATQMELERLKSLGFNTPSDAIRALRYPQRITLPEAKP